MANKNDKHPENVSGRWYVDTSCISCGLCGEYAGLVFRESSDGYQNVVYHQPENELELAQANEAKEGCPVDAIGDDAD